MVGQCGNNVDSFWGYFAGCEAVKCFMHFFISFDNEDEKVQSEKTLFDLLLRW